MGKWYRAAARQHSVRLTPLPVRHELRRIERCGAKRPVAAAEQGLTPWTACSQDMRRTCIE